MQLAGKTALVTGGASGIGAAISRRFAAVGANVIVADLDSRATQDIAAEISGEPWVIDLADTDAFESISLDVDILVNCAGIQRVYPIQDFPVDEWRLIQRLMLESPFLLIKAALPKMYERDYGRILNISSVHGLIASPFKSAYVSAKHGLEGLSKVVALEGAEHGVTSNCINPGYVRTPLVEKQIADQAKVHGISEERVVSDIMLKEAAIKRLVDPAEVADMALWLVSDNAQMVTGSSFTMDGGWTAN
ncbi:3-hydroxybutyrate dehydrogenase [Corynebacterium hindlerae]|uniref:3-hydroxybutyrate dehydrogenase n=1 Tax=Corynebacterium hindlerae TaxID=699041 RepID=UPI001AD6D9AF|nr:3-hydroxybutyrate dehydrogenase [Corynebacterium hindlerae]QTH60541.1 3-hydroxybutyrate dehydrogenase [Corynebacterium hindlerae]